MFRCFLTSTATTSVYTFSPKTNDDSFTVTYDEEQKQICTFEKLKPEIIGHIWLKMAINQLISCRSTNNTSTLRVTLQNEGFTHKTHHK